MFFLFNIKRCYRARLQGFRVQFPRFPLGTPGTITPLLATKCIEKKTAEEEGEAEEGDVQCCSCLSLSQIFG